MSGHRLAGIQALKCKLLQTIGILRDKEVAWTRWSAPKGMTRKCKGGLGVGIDCTLSRLTVGTEQANSSVIQTIKQMIGGIHPSGINVSIQHNNSIAFETHLGNCMAQTLSSDPTGCNS